MDHCSRCKRPVDQESDDFVNWEVEADGKTLICPDCLTAREENAIAEDAAETEVAARRLEADDETLERIEAEEGLS